MRYLVTGASGFIGWHLVSRLAEEGGDVVAWLNARDNDWKGMRVVKAKIDVTDAESVAAGVKAAAPDIIFHLAAQSLPVRSWADPAATMRTNIDGTLHLLEAVRHGGKPCRIIIAGSSAQYASNADGSPIGEDSASDPGSPYAVSKMAAESCAKLYARAFDLDVISFRPFFWIGPRKTGDVASDFARRIVAIERGADPILRVGRIDTVRDMIDVRDGVMALQLLAERGERAGAYNICSGKGASIAQLLDLFRSEARTTFDCECDPALMRPVDEAIRIGNPALMMDLGWQPRLSLRDSAAAILDYWRGVALA